MRIAIDAADFFSAGNTGATLLAAHAAFGMLPGVDRPALATTIPTLDRGGVLLDAGANVECRAQHLVQFAAMGTVYARLALGVDGPHVGLLSIGEEATTGNELTREAHKLLRASTLNFIGNVEARDVYTGQAEVIVCDGFTGNVALKISEGLVEVVERLLRDELGRTFSTRVGYLLSIRAFRRFRKRVDYSEYGGAPLLGVAGLCIVGHGRSSVKAVRNTVAMAIDLRARTSCRASLVRLRPCPCRTHKGSLLTSTARPRSLQLTCGATDSHDGVRLSGSGLTARRHGQSARRELSDLPGNVRASRRRARRAVEHALLRRAG
jgi:glycerol-3-phosphate acyltransferase PlsX